MKKYRRTIIRRRLKRIRRRTRRNKQKRGKVNGFLPYDSDLFWLIYIKTRNSSVLFFHDYYYGYYNKQSDNILESNIILEKLF